MSDPSWFGRTCIEDAWPLISPSSYPTLIPSTERLFAISWVFSLADRILSIDVVPASLLPVLCINLAVEFCKMGLSTFSASSEDPSVLGVPRFSTLDSMAGIMVLMFS